jgi:hypothetical protein
VGYTAFLSSPWSFNSSTSTLKHPMSLLDWCNNSFKKLYECIFSIGSHWKTLLEIWHYFWNIHLIHTFLQTYFFITLLTNVILFSAALLATIK